jgi:DNA polymerase III subunit beta
VTVQISQSALNDALKLVTPVVSKSGQLPIFSAVRLILNGGSGSAIATDGDLSVFAYINGETTLDGLDVVVPARHLAGFVNSVKGTITLDTVDNDLKVTAGGSSLTLRTMPEDDFPKIVTAEGDPVTLDATARAKLGRILYAASRDSARPILTGVGIGDGWAACTDSYRLAAVEIGGLPSAIIPARAFELVFKHSTGDVAVTVDDRKATFTTAAGSWTTRLIEGTFPNWRALIPASTPHVLIADRDTLIDAIDRVGVLVANDEPVRFEKCDVGVRLTVRSRDVGEATECVPAEMDFDQPIAFNGRYMTDLLKAGDEGKVDLGLVEVAKPACIGSLSDGSVSLLMPTRVM